MKPFFGSLDRGGHDRVIQPAKRLQHPGILNLDSEFPTRIVLATTTAHHVDRVDTRERLSSVCAEVEDEAGRRTFAGIRQADAHRISIFVLTGIEQYLVGVEIACKGTGHLRV